MHLRTHLWTSALAGIVCYPRSPRRAALLTLSGVLIDVDHLLLYMIQTGDRSLVGALVYNRYRNRPRRPGDTRPRYGPLRSSLHRPIMLLPLLALAYGSPKLRPVALGLTLHLLLDHVQTPLDWLMRRRAHGHCELCGKRSRSLKVHHIVHPLDGGKRTPENSVILCPCCAKRAADAYPVYPPTD